MSVNTAHASNGVLIHAGEYILIHSDNVTMDFAGQDNHLFKGTKHGRIYLTSHRIIFNSKKSEDKMQSFSAPFISLTDVELEQPVFGANYIKGKVRAQPNGNFVGEVKFKLYYKSGGAIEFAQALLRAASTAQSNMRNGHFSDDPPPYTPSGAWHEAPPPAYQPPPGYYGWLPQHDAFSGPAPNSVFMSDNPPPYPGIGGPPPYAGQQPYQPQPNQPSAPQFHQPPQQTPQQPPQAQTTESPSWMGFSLPPDDGHQPAQPAMQQPPQPQHQPQQPQQPPQYGYGAPGYVGYGVHGYGVTGYGAPSYGPPAYGAPGHGYDTNQAPQGYYTGHQSQPGIYNYQPGTAGGGAPQNANGPPANPKEAEAMASAYNNTAAYNPRGNNRNAGPSDMPPPSYNDLPPNYDAARKNQ